MAQGFRFCRSFLALFFDPDPSSENVPLDLGQSVIQAFLFVIVNILHAWKFRLPVEM
ncbi:hypothetical protein [Candidatus Methylacidithermus pantelleriae]|uniref:hypothetical protein n=1 Tax=Candidatus Methylacidithermus pantelleriae TaxID=2744239 RepID=UPI00157C4446|nr:hypothetical protein [Candidatus Methylacidithermus pantelleriae]